VRFAASVHAGSAREVLERPIVKRLLRCGAFDYIVLLTKPGQSAAAILSAEDWQPQAYEKPQTYENSQAYGQPQVHGEVPAC